MSETRKCHCHNGQSGAAKNKRNTVQPDHVASKLEGPRFDVLIVEGCLICNACETCCPEVFLVTDDTVTFVDGAAEHMDSLKDAIEEAIEGCPCEILHLVNKA